MRFFVLLEHIFQAFLPSPESRQLRCFRIKKTSQLGGLTLTLTLTLTLGETELEWCSLVPFSKSHWGHCKQVIDHHLNHYTVVMLEGML